MICTWLTYCLFQIQKLFNSKSGNDLWSTACAISIWHVTAMKIRWRHLHKIKKDLEWDMIEMLSRDTFFATPPNELLFSLIIHTYGVICKEAFVFTGDLCVKSRFRLHSYIIISIRHIIMRGHCNCINQINN